MTVPATQSHRDTMLRLSDVRKSYGKTVAVDGLSLQIAAGEVFGLLGPNGAGKSTTVALAVGLLEADRGTVEIAGAGGPADPAVRAKLGVAPQALALYEDLSGAENLRFFGTLQGMAGSALAERVRWALEFVGLTARARDRVSAYSGGMKRRLNLAVAVVHDPPLLLLDEPTVGAARSCSTRTEPSAASKPRTPPRRWRSWRAAAACPAFASSNRISRRCS